MVSGKTKEYLFSPSESAGDIAQFVFDNWPPEWEEESVSCQNEICSLEQTDYWFYCHVDL